MSFFSSLFSARSKGEANPPLGTMAARIPAWYTATSPNGQVRQVVLSFGPEQLAETELRTLILPANKFPILAMHSWCAGFCSINQQKIVLFRAGEFASTIQKCGLTMAISFCHLPSHPLLLVSIRAEAPEITGAVRRKYSHAPALRHPVAEWISGLNPYDRELIPGLFGSEKVRVALAEDSHNRNSVFMPNGQVQESALPQVVCEFQQPITSDLRKALDERWQALLAHDASIPSYRRDFQRAGGPELVSVLPTDKDPILPRKGR